MVQEYFLHFWWLEDKKGRGKILLKYVFKVDNVPSPLLSDSFSVARLQFAIVVLKVEMDSDGSGDSREQYRAKADCSLSDGSKFCFLLNKSIGLIYLGGIKLLITCI